MIICMVRSSLHFGLASIATILEHSSLLCFIASVECEGCVTFACAQHTKSTSMARRGARGVISGVAGTQPRAVKRAVSSRHRPAAGHE